MAANTELDPVKLQRFEKDKLIERLLELKKEKDVLRKEMDATRTLAGRVTELVRSHYIYLQYGRRESIEITGIPEDVPQRELENEVINIYEEAHVVVDGQKLKKDHILACHRIGKRGVTIVHFGNREYASQGLFNGKNLKGTKLYGDNM